MIAPDLFSDPHLAQEAAHVRRVGRQLRAEDLERGRRAVVAVGCAEHDARRSRAQLCLEPVRADVVADLRLGSSCRHAVTAPASDHV